MLLNFKTGGVIAAVWIATLIGAYWVGGGHDETTVTTAASQQSENGSAPSLAGAGLSANGDTGRGGTRTLSSSTGTRTAGSPGAGSAPEKLLRLLDGASGADLKRSEFEAIAENLSLEDVVEVIGQIAALPPGPAQRDAYGEVLARWARLDAAGALEHATKIGPPGLRRDATFRVLRNWAEVDPAAAVAFASSDTNTDLPDGSLSMVFRGIGDSMDTTDALDFLATVEDPDQQKYASQTVRELYERNDAEVIAWAEALPQGGMRDRAVQALAGQWARYDPVAARAWINQNTDESNRVAALAEFGESWARVDPQAAAAWAQDRLGDGADGSAGASKVLDRVFRRWMQTDFADAAGYLVDQEPSPELDGAVEQYIQKVKGVDPDATMAWAESITDPKRRRNAVLMVAKTWRAQDLQAYTDYVEASPIFSEQERDKLLGRPKEKPAPKLKSKTKGKIKKVKPLTG